MTLPEARCCGDHPGDWDRPAVPGTGWCSECLARLTARPDPRAAMADRNRILWNERDRDIDEIVISDVAVVHVEQMNERCWWIGITRDDGGYWAGNFVATSRGRMTFSEQEMEGFEWDRDDTHEVEP